MSEDDHRAGGLIKAAAKGINWVPWCGDTRSGRGEEEREGKSRIRAQN